MILTADHSGQRRLQYHKEPNSNLLGLAFNVSGDTLSAVTRNSYFVWQFVLGTSSSSMQSKEHKLVRVTKMCLFLFSDCSRYAKHKASMPYSHPLDQIRHASCRILSSQTLPSFSAFWLAVSFPRRGPIIALLADCFLASPEVTSYASVSGKGSVESAGIRMYSSSWTWPIVLEDNQTCVHRPTSYFQESLKNTPRCASSTRTPSLFESSSLTDRCRTSEWIRIEATVFHDAHCCLHLFILELSHTQGLIFGRYLGPCPPPKQRDTCETCEDDKVYPDVVAAYDVL